ncbi:hypothetical protein EDB19DRAFT_642846 [Suillus lakei]|nr:hypothetical protein EDB19DRAFT_642846 [Suillus lakei]
MASAYGALSPSRPVNPVSSWPTASPSVGQAEGSSTGRNKRKAVDGGKRGRSAFILRVIPIYVILSFVLRLQRLVPRIISHLHVSLVTSRRARVRTSHRTTYVIVHSFLCLLSFLSFHA